MNSKAICLLGMHRSGTSAVARAVNLLGAYLGEQDDLMSPAPENPEGFWERVDIVALDDRILRHHKRSWAANMPLPENWHRSEGVSHLRRELVELVRKAFLGHRVWAWKDPRTSVVFDIWKDALSELGVELSCVFVIRNPLDVARSLRKRNGFTEEKSFGIWFNYNISALKASAGLKRVFVSYDRFMCDWEAELERCSSALGLPWPKDISELKKEVGSFIRPELRHSVSGLDDLKRSGAPYPVVELYQMLAAASAAAEPGEGFCQRADELFKEFSSYSRFFGDDMARLRDLELKLPKSRRGPEKPNWLMSVLARVSKRDANGPGKA